MVALGKTSMFFHMFPHLCSFAPMAYFHVYIDILARIPEGSKFSSKKSLFCAHRWCFMCLRGVNRNDCHHHHHHHQHHPHMKRCKNGPMFGANMLHPQARPMWGEQGELPLMSSCLPWRSTKYCPVGKRVQTMPGNHPQNIFNMYM